MEFNTIEEIITAMQSSQFSMEEKQEMLIEFCKSLSQQEPTNNPSDKNSAFKAD